MMMMNGYYELSWCVDIAVFRNRYWLPCSTDLYSNCSVHRSKSAELTTDWCAL